MGPGIRNYRLLRCGTARCSVSRMRMRSVALLFLSFLLLVSKVWPQQKKAKNDDGTQLLPPGNGRELVISSCDTSCHNLKVIVSARKSRADWAKNVNDMIQRGAPVFPEEIEPMTTYLSEVFGATVPQPGKASSASSHKDQRPKPMDDPGSPKGRPKDSLKPARPEKKPPKERSKAPPSPQLYWNPTAPKDSAIGFLPPKPLLRPGLLATSITSYSAASFLSEREATKNLQLPNGYAKNLVLSACTPCHALEMTTTQRLNRAQWDSVVSEMVALGAHLRNDQVAMIVEYLARNFGDGSASPPREKRSSKTSSAASPMPHSTYR